MIIEKIRNFDHLQEAIVAVNQRIDDVKQGTTEKIKASSGLILTRKTENGEIEILMGRLNKKNRAVPNDPAEVHDSYAIFSGNVEENDTGKGATRRFCGCRT